jgi:hypothetical protein
MFRQLLTKLKQKTTPWVFPIAGAIINSRIVASQSNLSDWGDIIDDEEKIDKYNNIGLYRKDNTLSDRKIIEQAFRDQGYKHHVFLNRNSEASSPSAFVGSLGARPLDLLNKKAGALVSLDVQKNPDSLDPVKLYAVAGHEAVHVLHDHKLLELKFVGFGYGYLISEAYKLYKKSNLLKGMVTRMPMIYMGLRVLYWVFKNFRALSIFENLNDKQIKTVMKFVNFFSYHPSPEARCFYLNKLPNGTPLLFKSDLYKKYYAINDNNNTAQVNVKKPS